ncbi:hypothetical protein FRB96_002056 [Tulasnella sp. 330]|nr:hypothetical protein FRB96_002056 [Tulasnella sp. 330]KAG8884268.1 hypothetical protein FRB98_002541 [Tulasnella sp. 332]
MTSDLAEQPSLASTPHPTDIDASKGLLLCIFVHGFKGAEYSFGDFPSRLAHILDSTVTGLKSECIVFPAYETKGELHQATDRFIDWLTTLTVEREVAQGMGGGAGKARIVLCSHSMGGLLAADACLALARSRVDNKAPVWPNVIALISFDTPFLGLHPWVFKNQASKALEYAQTAHDVAQSLGFLGGSGKSATRTPKPSRTASPALPISLTPAEASASKSWTRLLTPAAGYTVGGVLLATAAAGTAYAHRQDIGSGVTWAQDHMKYVGNLWDEQKLGERVDSLMELSKESSDGGEGIVFRKPPTHPEPRTFIILPKPKVKAKPSNATIESADATKTPDAAEYFLAATNTIAPDEISAHTGMFDPKTNDGYYELGLGVVEIVRSALGEVPLSEAGAEEIVDKAHKVEEERDQTRGDMKENEMSSGGVDKEHRVMDDAGTPVSTDRKDAGDLMKT